MKYLRFAGLWAVFFSSIFWSACNRNVLSLKNANFNDQVDLTQNLVFEFNRPAGAKISKDWDSTAYIQFSPAVPGRFKWIEEDKLLFSPAYGFRPATEYKAQLTAKLASETDSEPIVFHTPYLQLTNARAFFSVDDEGKKVPKLKLRFNYQVKPENVLKLLTSDESDLRFKPAALTPGNEVTFFIYGISAENTEAKSLELKIKPGLACEETQVKSKEEMTYALTVPDPSKIEIQELKTTHDGTVGIVTVFATHDIKNESLKELISIKDVSYYWDQNTVPQSEYSVSATEGGLEIKGNFDVAKQFEVAVSPKLLGICGKEMNKEEIKNFSFASEGKGIEFESKRGLYLSGEGSRNIAVRISGADSVKVKIAKIYENTIQPFINQNLGSYYYEYSNDNAYEKDYTAFNINNYYNIEKFGEVIYEKNVNVSTLRKHNGGYLFNLNFKDPQKDYKGIYVMEIVSDDEYFVRAAKLIAISDIGISAKKTSDRITAFTHSLQSAEPLNDVKINLISGSNQTAFTDETDSDGQVKFQNLTKENKGFKEFTLLTARRGEDFNFLLLDKTQVPVSRFDVGGKTSSALYDGFIYGDRTLYRPGETVHINAIVRNQDLEPVPDMPVSLKIDFPNGQHFNTFYGKLNSEGSFLTEIELPASAMTGRYSVSLFTGADELITAYEFYAEEFTPDRMRVNISTDKDRVTTGQTIRSEVTANYFFGSPAAGRPYETVFTLKQKDFKPKGYNDFNFRIVGSAAFHEIRRTGKLNEKGIAEEKFLVAEEFKDLGLLEGKIFYSVFDESKRPVHRYVNTEVASQNVFFGIQNADRYIGSRTAVRIPITGLTAEGLPAIGTVAKVKVVRYKYTNVLRNRNGNYSYDSQKSEETLSDQNLTLGSAVTPFVFTFPNSGEYEVRVSRPGSKNYVKREFYAYGWGTVENAFEINTDGEITITAAKDEYKTGENAEILFKTPFDGRLLVSVEQKEVLETFQLTTDKRTAKLTLPLKDGFVPNVYLSATLIKPVADDGIPFTVAHGFQRLKVRDNSKLEVIINVPAEVRSRSTQTVYLQTTPNAEITVAAVDEGILQLRNTPTPDPHGFFYRLRALEVTSHDVYTYLFPEIGNRLASLKQSSTGGDGISGELRKRINPFLGKRFKLVSFFSKRLKADASGQAKFTFTLPQFAGEMRVMAVTYTGKKFGSGTKAVTVVDPVVINTALPRFLSPGDEINAPITIHNTTERSGAATVTVQTSGGLKINGSGTFSMQLSPKRETAVPVSFSAGNEIGLSKIKITVQSFGETYIDETEIGVRPASSYERQTGSGVIAAGKSSKTDLSEDDLIPSTMNGRLVVGSTPFVHLSGNFSDLIQYPYGCLEQTISTSFPQLYLTDIAPFMDLKNTSKKRIYDNPSQNVRAAIAKLQGLQIPGGGLAYWSGESFAQDWSSVYGLHFVTEARKAGYPVPEDFYNGLLQYVQRFAGKSVTAALSESADGYERRTYDSEVLRKMYSLYVLSLAGKKPLALLNFYRSEVNKIQTDSRFLLACSYLICGDENAYRSIVPQSFTEPNYPRETGVTFCSPLRDQALILNALLESDPNHPLIGNLARRVSQSLDKEQHPNTQELSFSLLALGKIARRSAETASTWSVTSGNEVLKPHSSGKGYAVYTGSLKNIKISNTGNGNVYYFKEVNGVRKTGGVKEEDHLISIRREFTDRSGKELGNNIRQNELVIVHLTLKASRSADIKNVVITDLLPAGFEIENTRLSGLPGMDHLTNVSTPDYSDFRDDRVHLFTSVSGDVKHFYYMVRAVTPGKYRLGAVSADAMYNGDLRSYSGAGILTVSEN